MRLFGWGARGTARPALARVRAGSVGAIGVIGMGACDGEWPAGYEAQARAAFMGNAVAQRAVRIVAEGAAGVPVDVSPDPHPAAALLRGASNGQPLVETVAAQLLLHNEALAILDAIAHPLALTLGDAAPPAARIAGQCWIVGASPVGEWAGHASALACWTDGGWRFIVPVEGMTVWLSAAGVPARYSGGAWRTGEIAAIRIVVGGDQVVGARGAAIPAPAGGSTVDAEARTALAAILSALVGHGLIAP